MIHSIQIFQRKYLRFWLVHAVHFPKSIFLPLLLGHLALDAVARHRGPPRRGGVAAAASALCLAWAMTAWDLVQFYVGLWVAFGVVQLFRGTLTFRARTGRIWLGHYAALATPRSPC